MAEKFTSWILSVSLELSRNPLNILVLQCIDQRIEHGGDYNIKKGNKLSFALRTPVSRLEVVKIAEP
jgi:hypothetical protein